MPTRLAHALTCFTILLFAACGSAAQAATFVVTTTADSGAGSLRAAIESANATAGPDTIVFQVSGTITLASALPILAESLVVEGPGADQLVINANEDQRHFRLGGVAGSQYEIRDLTLRNGRQESGGSILVISNASLTVRRCIIEDSTSETAGGAISAFGPLRLIDSIVRGNTAVFGGGVSVEGPGHEITGTTFLLNFAEQGGAVYVTAGAELGIENVTFTNNFAQNDLGSGFGGGLAVSGGLVAVSHSTFTGNIADIGGGISRTGGAFTTVANNILADNTTWTEAPSNCNADLPDDLGNLSSDFTCFLFGDSDLQGVDPLLDALADNGGPTPTQLPRPGSPAIDSAVNGFCAARDQRGRDRPESGGVQCDRGSVEVYPLEDHLRLVFADGFEG